MANQPVVKEPDMASPLVRQHARMAAGKPIPQTSNEKIPMASRRKSKRK